MELILEGRRLSDSLQPLVFSEPVTHTYLTVDYARDGYEGYLRKFGDSTKRVLLLGMNPGPYGMAQTGIPFGEINAVKDWMSLNPNIGKPQREHPKRKILGMDCPKSEVSGKRLWGLFAGRFPNADDFFQDHLVINYCPLIWMRGSGANLTPDRINASEMAAVDTACQSHLKRVIEILGPELLIGVGSYAEKQLILAKAELGVNAKVGRILHPSPASPAANRGWSEVAGKQLAELGVW